MDGRCQVCGLEGEISEEDGEHNDRCAACLAQRPTLESGAPATGEGLNTGTQRTVETQALVDTDPAFERPDCNEAAACPEDGPDEPQFSDFEHESWMSDLRSLASQSMAMNTNNRRDSSPEMRAAKNGTLMIQAPSVFPAAGPFELPRTIPDVAPAVAPPAPSGRSNGPIMALLAGLAALVAMGGVAIHTAMSRPMILQSSQLREAVRSAVATSVPEQAGDEGGARHRRKELPSPPHTTAMSTPLGGPGSAPMTPRSRNVETSNPADPFAPAPEKDEKKENPPAAEAPASPPAPSPHTLAEAIEHAAGSKPAAPATTPQPAAPQAQPFNRGAATSSLRGIAGSLSSCKSSSQGSGKGAIRVTFAPSGNATSAVLEGGPFAGTPTGSCVARRFRGARVPPFSGGPVTVRQGFTVR